VSRKALILTARSAKQVRCPIFLIVSDASYDSGTVYSLQTTLFFEKVVQADLLIANRSDTWTYQVLHALQDLPTSQQFWMQYDLVRLSINDSLNSLFVNISLGAGKILTF
jgi:hypothetical protein